MSLHLIWLSTKPTALGFGFELLGHSAKQTPWHKKRATLLRATHQPPISLQPKRLHCISHPSARTDFSPEPRSWTSFICGVPWRPWRSSPEWTWKAACRCGRFKQKRTERTHHCFSTCFVKDCQGRAILEETLWLGMGKPKKVLVSS